MMKHKKKNESYNYKNKISLIVLLFVITWFAYTVIKKGNINKQVYQNGEITNAIVIDKKKVGGKGKIKCTYSFLYKNVKYEGWVYNDNYKVGDTIKVKFLKDNPKVNNDYKFLQRVN
ncbi:MAG: hypothetical protein LLG13_16380 [Bacteroidales bacterium]|nr:hypothetical protein [Bacteroidales bacterium]